jgi:tetratricopeptide (TPR) repeat protein
MKSKQRRSLQLNLTQKILSFFPGHIQDLKEAEYNQAVSRIVRSLMDNVSGLIHSLTINRDTVKIDWEYIDNGISPQDSIVLLLNKKQYSDAILLSEIMLSDNPDQIEYLYNLGMAYSDIGEIDEAIKNLTGVLDIEPMHINARVALGVALTRSKQYDEAIEILKTAITQDPNNPWANRNLGGALAQNNQLEEAVPYLRTAAELNPSDQAAWYGLGMVLENLGEDLSDSDLAYKKVLELDEFSEIAELARSARSRIALKNFRSFSPTTERMDAVMYCLSALEKFSDMTIDEIQKIGFEIAILGTRGINVNDPQTRYTLRTLPGEFSGLNLLCLEYVAFKKFAPEQDIGFDLSKEYQSALNLFERKIR